ncbi:Ferric iron reductase FhuF-like transporter [Nonomuraea coxensis DSM 45129]|uniref:Ferric iron reductase FhuF-like transporter n=1 Tax=Nonomuraea coxensis DSM 45129 TaxID=1122611 RepID=A0ABX8UAN6_9ACTN|nr:IucA/IucC family C-terminal-domain containing protein [Nonomuraea coxensis]QYC44813.1 Ferric iron reductase FhuF-like transporter [Nonomuraea coxensis DSM 45129]
MRTVYVPDARVCLKFSLDVRITNCVRRNVWYELAGAVELSARLGPVFERVAAAHPATRWLPEPGYRTAARHPEGLGVIVRRSPWEVCDPGVTPVLAAALALGMRPAETPAEPVVWWRSYVAKVALPVLELFFAHGVVLEPHLQNVLVGLDGDGMPAQAVFRDLEGAKLVAGRHDLSGLRPEMAAALTYDAGHGWARVVYCLLVNHLTEIAAAVAGRDVALLRALWEAARELIAGQAAALTAPAYVYDLPGLDAHAAAVRRALAGVELYYAVKANPDAELRLPRHGGVRDGRRLRLEYLTPRLPHAPEAGVSSSSLLTLSTSATSPASSSRSTGRTVRPART